MKRFFLWSVWSVVAACCLHAQDNNDRNRPLAFPTAEGYGKYAVGGRGGSVYEVTTLEDSGPGSLREAVMAEGPGPIAIVDIGSSRAM